MTATSSPAPANGQLKFSEKLCYFLIQAGNISILGSVCA